MTSARFLLSLSAGLILAASSLQASTIVVVKAGDSAYGRRYFSGFSSLATEKISAFRYDSGKDTALMAHIKKLAPDLIFAIGDVPLKKLADMLPATPIIASNAYGAPVAERANVVLMESDPPFKTGLAFIQSLFPARKTVGTIYNPKLSQDQFNLLVTEAGKLGLRVASLKIDSAADAKSLINAFVGKIDAFYLIRDATTATDTALAAVYAFAVQNNIPVITPDPDQLQRGALMAVASDPFKLGEQAWQTAKVILAEKKIPQMPVASDSSQEVVSISLKASARFGIGADAFYAFLTRALKENYSVQVAP
ncbi:MAG: ABC transporter substrate binding protein [Pseudomonadota bacterium]